MERYIDLTGQQFGRWSVIRKAPDSITPKGTRYTRWWCRCSCGNPKLISVATSALRSGKSKSCGCLNNELRSARLKRFNSYEFQEGFVIGLTSKGIPFYFDADDYDKVAQYCWCVGSDGYLTTGSGRDGTAQKFHNLIMGKCEKGYVIDHINHDLMDNRKANLRIASLSENNINKFLSSNNKSGFTGVCWESGRNKWRAALSWNKRNIFLGRFDSFDDAVAARKAAEEKYFGEFSYNNSIAAVPRIAV